MKKAVSLILLITLTACSKKESGDIPFNAFVFSVDAMRQNFSLKINNSDTVYLQDRDISTGEFRNFYTLVEKPLRDTLVAIASRINFAEYGSVYNDENLMDGVGIKLYSKRGRVENSVYWYGKVPSDELGAAADKLYTLKGQMHFKPYHNNIDCGNLDEIRLPPWPKPTDIQNKNRKA
ncbi:hypothetical protein OGH69_05435 [Flavobacterium sp. MFBS3-15]|uniref:hypothetical protein n=1 Tax=Flavobacterium sp. MFBS3-15 TaxID=2989816 RepID=UPI002236494B|nr:hypothetical protein [Flavobacterium sp. MFBS3-15]MCW4468398.1 hypothetical protein [Flavobacterium sp. MFBS3-15]